MISSHTYGELDMFLQELNTRQVNLYTYDILYDGWNVFPPSMSLTHIDVSVVSVYLFHTIDHYDVVSFLRKTLNDL